MCYLLQINKKTWYEPSLNESVKFKHVNDYR